MYKAAFIDLDGTLLKNGKSIAKSDINQLVKFHNNGGNIILNSGRWHPSVKRFAEKINSISPGAVPYFASYNGAALFDVQKNKFLYFNSIPKTMFETAVEISNNFKVAILIYTSNSQNVYLNRLPLKFLFERYLNGKALDVKTVKNNNQPISKILFVAISFDKMRNLYNFLVENYQDQFNICQTHHRLIELNALNSDKGAVVDKVLEKLNLGKNTAVSIGDSLNDIAMFKKTNFSIGFNLKRKILLNNCSIIFKERDDFAFAFKKYVNNFVIKSKNIFIDCSLVNKENILEFSNLIQNLVQKNYKKIIFVSNRDFDEINEIKILTGSHASILIHNGSFVNNKTNHKIIKPHIVRENELILYYTNSNKIYFETKMEDFDVAEFINENTFIKGKEIKEFDVLNPLSGIVSSEKFIFSKENNKFLINYFDSIKNSKSQSMILKNFLIKNEITPNDSTGFFTQLINLNFPKEIFGMYINFNEQLDHLLQKIK